MNVFTVEKNTDNDNYEIVCWKSQNVAIVVQVNLKTEAEAEAARRRWQARERKES